MAGTSNIQIWDPNKINQETDATYAADSLRLNGGVDNGVFPSAIFNKAFYNTGAVPYALAQSLANKGFSISDADLPTLIATLSAILTTADIPAPLLTLIWESNQIFNATLASGFEVVLVGNITSSMLINATVGEQITFVFKQDSVGGRTVTMPSNTTGFSTPDQTANATSIQRGIYLSDGYLHPASPMIVS